MIEIVGRRRPGRSDNVTNAARYLGSSDISRYPIYVDPDVAFFLGPVGRSGTGVKLPRNTILFQQSGVDTPRCLWFHFFDISLAPIDVDADADTPADVEQVADELERYLALPVEKNMNLDVLAWGKAKDCKDGLPALAKMARQYPGRPASSAGVERMFSKAGNLYGDEKKGQEDETLENSLFAAANTEYRCGK